MFTNLPKSDVLLKIFVKMTQKIQILLDIFIFLIFFYFYFFIVD